MRNLLPHRTCLEAIRYNFAIYLKLVLKVWSSLSALLRRDLDDDDDEKEAVYDSKRLSTGSDDFGFDIAGWKCVGGALVADEPEEDAVDD